MLRGPIAVAALALALLATPAHAQVVALGASNTDGWGVGRAAAFPAQLERRLHDDGYNVTVTNAGVSGDGTGQMLARLELCGSARHPRRAVRSRRRPVQQLAPRRRARRGTAGHRRDQGETRRRTHQSHRRPHQSRHDARPAAGRSPAFDPRGSRPPRRSAGAERRTRARRPLSGRVGARLWRRRLGVGRQQRQSSSDRGFHLENCGRSN